MLQLYWLLWLLGEYACATTQDISTEKTALSLTDHLDIFPFRCAFMPMDTQAGSSQIARLLQHSQPQILIWGTPDSAGGVGPIDPSGLPDGCQAVQMPTLHMPPHDPASGKRPSIDTSEHMSDRDKHVQQLLAELVAEWQKLIAGRPKLPFCYVMHTSGSTGTPAGVCGTETGQCPFGPLLTESVSAKPDPHPTTTY